MEEERGLDRSAAMQDGDGAQCPGHPKRRRHIVPCLPFASPPTSFSGSSIARGWYLSALAVDEEGGIWYTAANKLTRLINDDMSVSYDCSYICYDMQFDSQQRLWMADHHGPLRMMENGAFTSYPCPFESKRWMCMDIDSDNIYIGTDTDPM